MLKLCFLQFIYLNRRASLVVLPFLLFAGCGSSASSPTTPTGTPPVAPPAAKALNVVVIMTDDQDQASSRDMPIMQSLIAAQGVTFLNAISTTPLCGPSRASILTGRYAHNHAIRSNAPPLGGYGKYRDSGQEGDSLPVWLKSAGYRTAYFGKYTNGYGAGWTSKPPGWDTWLAFTEPQAYLGFTVNQDGRDLKPTPDEYSTDYLSNRAIEYLRLTEENDDQPFFLMIAPYAPHRLARPAPRHSTMFPSRGAPRTPAFDEDNIEDKPRHMKRIPRFGSATVSAIDNEYRNSLRALQAVDEMIEKVVQALTAQGEIENTAIVFMADNGFSNGAHRFTDKTAPYAESLDIPMYIRVPGGVKGVALPHLVANIDIPATILEWARIQTPSTMEGRSLTPLLSGASPAISDWRSDLLVEYWDNTNPATTLMPTYQGVRVETDIESALYVQHDTSEEEFYDFRKDPYQLNSAVAGNPSAVNRLNARMKVLAACQGVSCR
jgi:N-acetylglucosamine-6-sulfatase